MTMIPGSASTSTLFFCILMKTSCSEIIRGAVDEPTNIIFFYICVVSVNEVSFGVTPQTLFRQ